MDIKRFYQFNAALADGPYAFPGGYPRYFITSDGDALSFKSAQENAGLIRDAIIADDTQSGWRVCAVAINWEDADMFCSHSGELIESAYGEE